MDRTPNAAAFVAANAQSPVVAGAATHRGEERPENVTGCRYKLQNGQSFRLSSAECRTVEPRWNF